MKDIMVKRNKKEIAAPYVNRTRDEDAARLAVVAEADAKWERRLAAKPHSEKKIPTPSPGAIEESFVSYSPMSDIVQDDTDDITVDAIIPLEETVSDSGGNSEEKMDMESDRKSVV